MERDMGQALERLKVKEQPELDYDVYLSLKTDVSLVVMDYETGEKQGDAKAMVGFFMGNFYVLVRSGVWHAHHAWCY